MLKLLSKTNAKIYFLNRVTSALAFGALAGSVPMRYESYCFEPMNQLKMSSCLDVNSCTNYFEIFFVAFGDSFRIYTSHLQCDCVT